MEGYLGQVCRSRVKVMKSKNVHSDIPLTYESLVYGPADEETWGVFIAYAVSLLKFLFFFSVGFPVGMLLASSRVTTQTR